MTTAAKIRLLLGLLFASLLFTATVVEKTYTPANNLAQTAKAFENNLHGQENYVYNALNDPDTFADMMSLSVNHPRAISFINNFTINRNIWFITLRNGKLSFYSGAKVVPESYDRIREGSSFIKYANGNYEVIKHTRGNSTIIFFILVKNNFKIQNKFLQNGFAKFISQDKNIDIADISDHNVYAVHDVKGSYLFSLKLIDGKVNNRFFYFQLGIWIVAIITLCILIHDIVTYLANKRNQVYLALLALASFIILFRFINLYYGWPSFTQPLVLFSPSLYASNKVFPSLGDFCLNVLALTWFTAFLYTQRNKLINTLPGKYASWLIYAVCVLVLFVTSTALLNLFEGLVLNSKISFDVNNVLNLSGYSFLGVLMLCFSFLLFVLATEVVLTICATLSISAFYQALVFVACSLLATIYTIYAGHFSLFYLLWAALVIVRGYTYLFEGKKFGATSFVLIVLVCALISSVKLAYFQSVKENETRKLLIQRLEVPDDLTADALFKNVERDITVDAAVVSYFKDTEHDNAFLKMRLQKAYFDRYLSRYDFKVHDFDAQDRPLSSDGDYSVDNFKDLVLYSSIKVSDYFYRANDSFGSQSYFAILPVKDGDRTLGTLIIELKSKPLLAPGTFPELLIDKELQADAEYKNYSYAFYADNRLVEQSGTFIYNITNKGFKGALKKYVVQNTESTRPGWFERFVRYSHLIYMPGPRNMIVVSMEQNMLLTNITALTFFFVVLLAFGALILLIRLLWIRVRLFNVNNDTIKWNFRISFDNILYRTRIQFSVIIAVVVTLVMVGIITFLSISRQYQEQQDRLIRSKILQITSALESNWINNIDNITEQSRVEFDQLAATYSTDVTLFNLAGQPLITTQPKIYDYGLLCRHINTRAFIALAGQQQSEYVSEEHISGLAYKAAYTPVRNSKHQTVAYLQLPYFSNLADYTEQIGSLLNIMINVYALVFIAIGLFAVIIARQITAPLNFIQYNLSRTIYGKKNEPIKWERDDEIGALVKEYNNMIAALENSAIKLAQSERETAWREMAKQVAHEIKNPLTPLKLGLQLLDKSWKDKDPKFDQKFERFSKSFVEQIESLSSIASEFSAFAKMPDTRIENIDIFEMLNQAVIIFKQMDNVSITFTKPGTPFIIGADRDQLLRCFNNLLKNAIEATPQDRRCEIDIEYLITNKNILFTIKDNGNGIPENMRDKIFEPNFTTKSSGTGLGLAFVKNSIENANGKVWFETTTGVGTTFYLSFPAAEKV
ncbi:GHKL domain-containing protein [Mucilaginibacter pallidiroseus]|uniref:histidine kinase n=1 Tax=Mucilaginibacter pallidiroseus TaxID=2599295 RepID=A0A563UH28_9SPHI|nr:ATP-binding protein [Mucilaginibacter pallidiroseus]TWR30579.1 GHKL domain-containing protein [Mucilaginibacter pallidiroseus]